MLRGIHKASTNWLGKAVMALVMGTLVVSFAIWGIGDIFRGFGQSTVAKIGGTEITIDQFRNYYTDKMSQLGRRLGRPLSPDQARVLGLDKQLVSQLVAETTLDQKTRALRLGASNDQIAKFITADPSFRGLNGQFDRAAFQQMIRQAGYSEASYVNEQRAVTLRRQLAVSVSGDVKVPASMMDAINRFQNEKRSVELVTLGAPQAGDIPKPDAETLAKYFDERKVLFRAPETRKVVLLVLSPADQARWSVIPDADAKSYYEQHKADYGSPEKRELRQITFANMDDAKATSERVVKSTSFDDIVKERGLKDTDTDLGTITKAEMIDPAIADAAFALKAGEISAPVQGRFATVILQVKKIEPETQKPYEAVADQIKQTMATQRARNEINTLRDRIEDERAAGSTLAEAGKKLGLATRTIDAIDRSGRDTSGDPVANLPQGADIVSAAFSTDVGVESDPLQLPNGGLVWVDVAQITRSHERSLDEVKDQVETRWRDDETATRLKAKSDDMLTKLKAGSTLSQVASENGLKVETVADLQRGKPTPQVGVKTLDAVFRTAKGAPGTSEGEKPSERTIFVVTAIDAPKIEAGSEQAKTLLDNLQRSYSDAIVSEYVAKLENDIGVTINEAAVNQITGGGRTN
ncbi:MAG: SurA N-terminal domain-containing protein [Pseudolabrys sp.]|nr:SurA N-terminal domain-containing protein [Pseudolabrys sp.]